MNGYPSFLYKMFENHLWNSFPLYLLVEILQLAHEISSFPEMLYKRGVLKNFSKFIEKHSSHPEKQSSGGVMTKHVLKNFAKFTEKHLCWNLLFKKVAGWKIETVRSRHWRCSVKQGVLKNFVNFTRVSFQKSCSSESL